MKMIKFLDIKELTDSFQPELGRAIERVVESGYFVRGREVRHFEEAYAAFTGASCCVGVGNGFDALRLVFKAWLLSGAMEEGDEVIVPANTYIASILAVSENRLTPVLVEPDPDSLIVHADKIAEKITDRTRAIMVVHLYGRNAMSEEIQSLAETHHLKILEDNAQAAGCFCGERRTGSLGDAGAHSFFPTKNLGALGDAGAVTTDDPDLAAAVRTLGNYGSHEKGVNDIQGLNSRMDELQAAVLNVKLPRLDRDNSKRQKAALFYRTHITHPGVILPPAPAGETVAEHVWHLFVVRSRKRDALQRFLAKNNIQTFVHYPIPPHKQQAYKALNGLSLPITEQIHREVLSLPLSPVMDEDELRRVAEVVNGFS